MVELVSACLKLVVHVQGNDHLHIHVNELCGQVKVAFKVRCVHHIDDHIRSFFNDMFAYIDFFWRVGGKRIGTWQVDNAEMIALEIEEAFFGINGYTTIIAHMFVCPAGNIK